MSTILDIDDALLRDWPLPLPSPDGDKEERGRVLVIGGSCEMPGAVILAATAALQAGAGKLAIATGRSVAQLVALAIPESRVIALPETADGGFEPESVELLDKISRSLDAVVIGPGMQDEAATVHFASALLQRFPQVATVLDAYAMGAVKAMREDETSQLAQVLLTPHAGEMAHLTELSKEEVLADPLSTARKAAARWQAIVALKGAVTHIADQNGRIWRHEGGNIGLAVSGSGDTLAGVIAGLAARGASLPQAAAWGVALHARAGERLARRVGPLGYLARDLPAEIPAVMHLLANKQSVE
jgi:hydroxyethylthiazole kinase-like uncharacterized protein yjeF